MSKSVGFLTSLGYRVGGLLRETAQALDQAGSRLQGSYAFLEEINRHQAVTPLLGKAPALGQSVFVAPNASVIGSVAVGDRSSIWYGAVLRGDVQAITVGKNTNIQDNAVVHVTSGIGLSPSRAVSIGSNVTVGHGAVLHACTIEDEALVGMGAVILDGAVVEKNSLVAAGAIVTPGTRVPSGQVWAGNPAKFLRALSKEEIAYFKTSAESYSGLAKQHIEETGKSFDEVWRDKVIAYEKIINKANYPVDPNPFDPAYPAKKYVLTGETTAKAIN